MKNPWSQLIDLTLLFQLLSLASGKVALVLEGGYSMDALCDSAEQCSRALMGQPIEKISHDELSRPPCYNAVETLQKTVGADWLTII